MAVTLHACQDCGEGVIRARTEALKWQLIDATPDPEGRVAIRVDAMETAFARTLRDGELPAGGERLHLPHYATHPACRDKDRRRREAARRERAAAQHQAWRAELARQAAGKRSRRARRPQPPITGIRYNPGNRP